jgi:signal transduction histidine kinase
VKQKLSRQELKAVLQKESLFTIYLTALVFVTVGSLWMHFTLKSYFWHPWLFSTWLFLHLSCLMALQHPKRATLHMICGLGIFQAYCFFLLAQGLPFVPLAPLFFSISALCLSSTWIWPTRYALGFWALVWISALSWSKPLYWSYAQGRSAVFITLAIHCVFHFSFAALAKLYSRRQKQYLQDMFGQFSYDTQRIHAGRLQLLGELSASLAHEISASILNIHGYQYQLQEEVRELKLGNNIVTQALSRLDKNIHHVMNVVRALRSFSRKDSGKNEARCSIRELTQEAVDITAEHLKLAKVKFEFKVPETDFLVKGSKIELEQVLINFLINARDACLRSPIKKVSLEVEEVGESLCIKVTDTGGGVPEDLKSKIFEPFFSTKEGAGTGLGLHLCQIIAKRQNAEIKLSTIQGPASNGACFELWVRKADAANIAAA